MKFDNKVHFPSPEAMMCTNYSNIITELDLVVFPFSFYLFFCSSISSLDFKFIYICPAAGCSKMLIKIESRRIWKRFIRDERKKTGILKFSAVISTMFRLKNTRRLQKPTWMPPKNLGFGFTFCQLFTFLHEKLYWATS